MTINQIQDEIVNDFLFLEENLEMKILYIIEQGQKLSAMSNHDKVEKNEIKGCQSKVWMNATLVNQKIHFEADSNTSITKGLVSLLIRIFNNQTPADILRADLYFIHKIHMERFIGTQRSNGFTAMIKQIKLYAFAFNEKLVN